jgi:hypothetical protein
MPLRYGTGMQVRRGSSAELFEILGRFRRAWPKSGWSWDTRFGCVASSFGLELVKEARTAIVVAFPCEWTMKNIASAPSVVREIAETTGGIRPDQNLFSTNLEGRLTGYGLWWPWGDDVTISMRVGLGGYVTDADTVRLRELFNALD